MSNTQDVMIDGGSVVSTRDGGRRAPGRGRRRRVGVGVSVVLALVALAGAMQWRASYAPLAFEDRAMLELGDRLSGGDAQPGGQLIGGIDIGPGIDRAPDSSDGDGRGPAVLRYRDGEHVTYAVRLHNGGSVGVTVLGLDDFEGHQLLKPFEVRVGKVLPGGESSVTVTEPRRSFTLAAGDSRSLIVHLRFSDCEWVMPGGSQTVTGWSVRYRVLGLTRAVVLDLPLELSVESPATCPRPRREAGPKDQSASTPKAVPAPSDR